MIYARHANPHFSSSIIHLFELWFLKLLNILKDYIFKSSRFFIILKYCPVPIQTSDIPDEKFPFYCKLISGQFWAEMGKIEVCTSTGQSLSKCLLSSTGNLKDLEIWFSIVYFFKNQLLNNSVIKKEIGVIFWVSILYIFYGIRYTVVTVQGWVLGKRRASYIYALFDLMTQNSLKR